MASRFRRSLLAGTATATLVGAGLFFPTSVQAANECGNIPAGPNSTVECTSVTISTSVRYEPVQSNETFTLNIGDGTEGGQAFVTAQGFGASGVVIGDLNFLGVLTGGVNATSVLNVNAFSEVTGNSNGVIVWTDGAGNDATVNNAGQVVSSGAGFGSTGIAINVIAGNAFGGPAGSGNAFGTNSGTASSRNTALNVYSTNGNATASNSNTLTSQNGNGINIGDPTTGLLPVGGTGTATNSGTITANGANGNGIRITSNGDATATNQAGGDINAGNNGIQASSIASSFVANNGAVTATNGTGILALGGIAGGAGGVTVDTTPGLTESTNGSGIIAGAVGSGAVLVDAGDINAGANGLALPGPLSALALGGGAIGVSNSGSSTVNALGDIAVSAGGRFGAAAISVSGAANLNFIGGNVNERTVGDGGPDVGGAAIVLSDDADATITVGNTEAPHSLIRGNDVGLLASNSGTGDATIDADAVGSDGQQQVDAGGTGMIALGLNTGDAVVDTGIINSNLNGTGGVETLFGALLSGDPTALATALPDSGSGAIAFATGGGNAIVTNYGEITANDGAFGAAAISFGGNATVRARADIDPPDVGMFPFSVGGGNALGEVADGVTVDSNYVGILAGNIGTGSVVVNVGEGGEGEAGGAVTSGGVGVFLLKDGGVDGTGEDENPTNSGNVINVRANSSIIGDAAGIVISAGLANGNGNSATINNEGLIQGNSGAITLPAPLPPIPLLQVGVINSYTNGTLTINNGFDGVIRGDLAAAAEGTPDEFTDADLGAFELALAASGGAATVNNNGLIAGNVALFSNDNNTVDNNYFGFWNTAGVNLIGGGDNDVLNNNGIISTHLITAFVGLENFNNYNGGLLTMQDGIVNDITTTDGNFNGSAGGFSGTLAFDAYLRPGGTADLLVIGAGTDIAAGNLTGETFVDVNDLDNGLGQFDPNGVLFALEGGSPEDGGRFYTDGGIDKGFFRYDVYYRSPEATQNDQGYTEWVLASLPDQEAYEFPVIVSGAAELWNQSTGTWLDRTADLRTAFGTTAGGTSFNADLPEEMASPARSTGAWARVYGGTQGRDFSNTVSAADFDLVGADTTFDSSYDQSFGGFTAGFDFVRAGQGDSAWIFGLMAGYGASSLDFDGSDTDVDYQAGSVGGYVTYLNGGLFVDATVKADFGNIDYSTDAGGGASGSFDTDYTAVGFVVDTGYRMNMASGWFFEPKATISYVNVDIDEASVLGTDVSFDDGNSVRGRLGARVGNKMQSENAVFEPFVEASVWGEFDGDYSASLGSGGFEPSVSHDTGGAYGEVVGGVNVFGTSSSWSGFAKGAVTFGDDSFLGVTGNIGIRKDF